MGHLTALAQLTEPVGSSAFLDEHWDRRPLLATGDGIRAFDDLLSVAAVDDLLSAGQLRPPNIRLVLDGTPVDPRWSPSDPADPVVDPARVAAAFSDGATVVVQQIHRWWHPVAVFCRQLEADLGHPTQANAYLSPPSARGLPLHHDTHDVFVLQVSGRKDWRVYQPTQPFPLPYQRYAGAARPGEEPCLSTTLRAGDVLYLPRGWRHLAATSGEQSFHLTVGVHVHTWLDALRDALLDCDDEVDFRRAVPPDGATDARLLEALAARLRPEAVAARMRRRLVVTRRPIADRQLAQVAGLGALTRQDKVRRRSTVLADLDLDGDRPVLRFEGKELLFPAPAGAAVRFCHRAAAPFTPAALPGLDDEGQLVLVRRLVREGFLDLGG